MKGKVKMAKNVLVQCNVCKKFFSMGKIKVKERHNIKLDKERADLFYYRCPKCKQIYIVGIMTDEAKRLQNKHKECADNVTKMIMNKQIPTEDMIKLVEQSKKANIEYQKNLVKQYSDIIPYDIL